MTPDFDRAGSIMLYETVKDKFIYVISQVNQVL